MLLGKASKTTNFDFRSPDNTSDVFLKKLWKIIDGRRCLLKAGSPPFMQQPFNEVIAPVIAERLEISYIPYTLLWDDGIPYSVCEDFITPDTELVSAWRVMQPVKKQNSISTHQHYLNCCDSHGVSSIQRAVDQIIVLDYLIANEDRHQNNFGLIRNANTLEWFGATPIFDSGSSLGFDKLPGKNLSGSGMACKFFKKTHVKQLKPVFSFEWIDFDQLGDVEDEMRSVLSKAGEYMDEVRMKAMSAYAFQLERLMEQSQTQVREDQLSEDVERDAAQDYKLNQMGLDSDQKK